MTDVIETHRSTAARVAGGGLLYMVVGGILYWVMVGAKLTVPGGTAATADHALAHEQLVRVATAYEATLAIAIAAVAASMYSLIRPVRTTLGPLALAWMLVSAGVVAGMAVTSFTAVHALLSPSAQGLGRDGVQNLFGTYMNVRMAGHTVSSVFLDLGMTTFLYVLYRSRLLPRGVAGFGMASYGLMLLLAAVNIVTPRSPVTIMIAEDVFDTVAVLSSILFELIAGTWLLLTGSRLGVDGPSDLAPAES